MLLRYLGAGAIALALIILPHNPAFAAGMPLVTGKCGCRIGWGVFIAPCGSAHVTCTKQMCAAACQAALPKKTSREITDVSAARRIGRNRAHIRVASLPPARYRGGSTSRTRNRIVPPPRMDLARASQTDRDGRGYAVAEDRVRAPIRTATHWRALGVARAAIIGAAIGGHGGVTRVCAGSSCGTVVGWAAEKFRGLFADLVAAGYRLGSPGCLSGGHMRHSLHHWGGACDLFNQYDRNKTHLPQPPPAVQIELAAKHGLTSGCVWRNPDCGHFDLSGIGMGRRYARNGRG